jgi:DNA topoisomerase-1
VPPAWQDVWICGDPRGHIQATGRDARGRTQYRYHPDFRAHRDVTKCDRLATRWEAASARGSRLLLPDERRLVRVLKAGRRIRRAA